ncbi:MAG TPA: hypothetical protein VGF79_00180 [Bacteroidia bacterium]
MQKKSYKILILLTFMCLFFGSAFFMYFKYIHNKPKIKMNQARTKVNSNQFDSALRANTRQIK